MDYTEDLERLKINDLNLLAACPASVGPGSNLAAPQLDRWIAVHDAIAEWYASDQPDEHAVPAIADRVLGRMDPVQRQIAETLFANYRMLMPKSRDEAVDLDPPWSTVYDTASNSSISVATQFGLRTPDEVTLIKLKTGRSRVSDDEKAVLIEGAADPAARFLEVLVADGTVDELELPHEERGAIIDRLFAIPDRNRTLERRGTRPGLHCFRCSRPAECGQYPRLDGEQVIRTERTVIMTKKWLAKLNLCERQAAWARLYGIPHDDVESDDESWGAAAGSTFHQAAAAALLPVRAHPRRDAHGDRSRVRRCRDDPVSAHLRRRQSQRLRRISSGAASRWADFAKNPYPKRGIGR